MTHIPLANTRCNAFRGGITIGDLYYFARSRIFTRDSGTSEDTRAAETHIVIRIAGYPIQIRGKRTSIRAIVPIPTAKQMNCFRFYPSREAVCMHPNASRVCKDFLQAKIIFLISSIFSDATS
jgi:hypothetical protein